MAMIYKGMMHANGAAVWSTEFVPRFTETELERAAIEFDNVALAYIGKKDLSLEEVTELRVARETFIRLEQQWTVFLNEFTEEMVLVFAIAMKEFKDYNRAWTLTYNVGRACYIPVNERTIGFAVQHAARKYTESLIE